jgi:hypothetical protein
VLGNPFIDADEVEVSATGSAVGEFDLAEDEAVVADVAGVFDGLAGWLEEAVEVGGVGAEKVGVDGVLAARVWC